MLAIIITEIEKLKRYAVLKAGVIVVIFSVLYSFAPVLANDGFREDFPIVMNNILRSNCINFFPSMIVLIGGFIARREYTEDTLKNVLTVPVLIRKLLLGKVLVLFFLTIFFSVLSGLLGIILCVISSLSNVTIPLMIEWITRIVLGNIFLFIALLPITIISTFSVDTVYVCTAVGFVYGFLASFEWAPLNFYPVKAVLILFDPQCGVGYDFLHYSKGSALVALLIVFCISVGLFIFLKPTKKLKKVKTPKKAVRAKGW
mgnify:CR=1 FL=1